MPHNKVAFDWLEENVDLFVPTESMLYVGWRPRSKDWWYTFFGPAIGTKRIGLIEAFEGNFSAFCVDGVEKFLGDVRKIDEAFERDEWDMVFWDHGPEHAGDENDLRDATILLQDWTSIVLYACPWGTCPQGASNGNKYEEHGVSVYPEFLEGLGMTTKTFGNGPDRGANSEIVAWWKRDDNQ